MSRLGGWPGIRLLTGIVAMGLSLPGLVRAEGHVAAAADSPFAATPSASEASGSATRAAVSAGGGGPSPDSTSAPAGASAPFVRAPEVKLAYPGTPHAISFAYPGSMPSRVDLWGPHREVVELNRFQTSVVGADRGAYLGLATGCVGSVLLGLWDEKTAMQMAAAGAALGALWGGTLGNDQLHMQVRVRDD